METKVCNRCNIEKSISEFSPTSPYKGKTYYRGECKECNRTIQKMPSAKAAQKKYRSTDKYIKVKHKRRRQPDNWAKELAQGRTPEAREKARNRKKLQYHTDPLNNLKVRLRARFKNALKAKNLDKQKSVADLIGLPLPEFKIYIEKQFKPGMTWEDISSYHIDHIIPLDSAKTPEEMYKLWHYTNLQPLYPSENIQKSNKIGA